MEDHRFDDLTKSLAVPGLSRRQLLLRTVTGVAGAMFATFVPSRALADGSGGNSTCAHFCSAIFDDIGDLTGQCVSAAAHGQGLCYDCGPAAPAGHGPVCGVQTAGAFCCRPGETCCSNATCANLQTDTLNCGSCGNQCIPGAVCQSGQCACPTGTVECGGSCVSNVCAPGQTFNPKICKCEAAPHPECVGSTCSTFKPCTSSNADCVCVTTAESGGLCIPGSTGCLGLPSCVTSTDCPSGSLCAVNTCCRGGVCVSVALSALCPSSGTSPMQASGPTRFSFGPTIAGR